MPSDHIQFVGDAIHKSFRIVWHDLMISGVWPHGCDGRPSPYWSVPLSAVCACARVHLCVLVHLCTVCTCIVVLCAVCCVPVQMCVPVCLSLRNMLQWLSVLVWDVFRQRTISKVLIRQFDFNETSSVDSRQQYKLSMKNGKKKSEIILSFNFELCLTLNTTFLFQLFFLFCGSYWLPVNCLQTKFLNISQYKEVCIQKVFNNGNSLPSTKIFDNLKSFAPNTNIWQEK